MGNEWVKLKKNKPKGFALPYGAHSVGEDITTVAELLFASQDQVEKATEGDDILRKKIEYLKELYKKKDEGKMKL